MNEILNAVPPHRLEEAQNFINDSQNKEHTPLIVKILMALGAYFASGFILSFISPLFLFFQSLTTLFSIALIALIIYLSKRVKVQGGAMQVFWNNILLFSMLSAKTVLIFGILKDSKPDINTIFLIVLATNAIVYPLFKNSADRFIGMFFTASLAFLLTIGGLNHFFKKGFFLWQIISPDLAVSLIFGAALLIFIKGKKALFPLAYALVFATVFNLGNLISTTALADFFKNANTTVPSFLSIMFAPAKLLALLFALTALYYHYKQKEINPHISVIIITTLLCLPLNTGCIMGLAFIFTARYTFNARLMQFGYIIFIASLSFFYYNLNTTLMQKAGLLVISGLVLLAAAELLRRQKNAA